MRERIVLAVAVAGVLIGCTNKDPRRATGPGGTQIDPDSPLIEETVEPKIDYDTHLAAASLAETRGQWPTAVGQYEKALEEKPNDQTALRRLAVAQSKLGLSAQAIATWEKYRAVTQDSAEALGGLGYAYELAYRPADAEKTYQDGIAKYPNSQLLRVNYGLMLARLGQEEAAVTQLKTVLKPAEVEYNLASVYEQQGKLTEAQAHYRAAIALDPRFNAAQQRLAKIE